MVDAVVFDMDGTLVDSESLSLKCWVLAANEAHLELSQHVALSFIGKNRVALMDALAAHVGSFEVAQSLYERHEALAHELAPTDLRLKPGARACLEALQAQGVPLALATSSEQELAQSKLGRFNLESFFTAIVCGDEVERSKPEPDIFCEATRRLGVDPTRSAAVEDSLNGVRAAHAAGMMVFMIPDLVEPTPDILALNPHRLQGLDELVAALASC